MFLSCLGYHSAYLERAGIKLPLDTSHSVFLMSGHASLVDYRREDFIVTWVSVCVISDSLRK